jgi:acyl dehydratase/NAD(P)-dependent dehydrogenase (short-subunit alcohol dehydrogenase family)
MAHFLGERRFSFADQEFFAAISGDRNPIHLDEIAARRELTRGPIVHGVHLLLWSLDAFFAKADEARPIASLKVSFEKFVPVGAAAQASFTPRGDDSVRVEVARDQEVAVTAVLTYGEPIRTAKRGADRPWPTFAPVEPTPLRFEDLPAGDLRGACVLPCDDTIGSAFPAAARALGTRRVCGLACASFIVGMVCPGLASIFRSLNLSATTPESAEDMKFELARQDERFRLVRLAVEGGGWSGSIDAHFRPPPVDQPAISAIAKNVQRNEFKGADALVIGGSRGLGELTAKVLAAGGARVTLTYSSGEADAKRVQSQIMSFGGQCDVTRYDVLSPSRAQLAFLAQPPNQIYYMASPAIVPHTKGQFDRELFEFYGKFSVDGLSDLHAALRAMTRERFAIFYPSTSFIDSRPRGFTEYAMAKAAGEILCEDIEKDDGDCVVVKARLPRLATDQTLSLTNEEFQDALELLLPLARRLYAALDLGGALKE